MVSTVHQRFASRLPSFEQEMGEELFVSGLVVPYRIIQRKNGHHHGIDDATDDREGHQPGGLPGLGN
jgi:hypothetical protein